MRTTQLSWVMVTAVVAAVAAFGSGLVGQSPPAGASTDDIELVDAWVKTGLIRNSGPGVGDVDGDGEDDLAIGGEDGILRVFRSGDLDDLLWEVAAVPSVAPFCTPQSTPTSIDAGPVIGDIDGDGRAEVIVGMGSTYVLNQNGGLNVYEHDGTLKWRWTSMIDEFNVWDPTTGATPDGYCEGVISDSALGDVNGDGHVDVVFGSWDHQIHALDGRTGQQISGFPFDQVDTVWSSPALFDVDGDGRDEVFIGGDDTGGIPNHFDGGQFHALSWEDGVVTEFWKRNPIEAVMGGVAVADADRDGRYEVYVTTAVNYDTADTRRILAWYADDGSVVPGWPVEQGGRTTGDVAVGDLDGDGQLEIVAGTWEGTVSAWRPDGSLLWRTEICCNPAAPNLNGVGGDAVIADADGDGDQDVIVGSGWGMQLLDGRTGVRLEELAIGLSYSSSPAVIEQPDGERLLVTSGYSLPVNRHEVQTFRLPASSAEAQWPTGRGAGGGRAAVASCDAPPAHSAGAGSGAGYWMLEADGTVYPFGDARDHGDLASRDVTARAVDLEPTPSGDGYYILDALGCVHAFGDAVHHGHAADADLGSGERATTVSATAAGYLVATNRGRVVPFGDATSYGDMRDVVLNGPVLGSSVQPAFDGYYLVGSDGGIFSYGSAGFQGSMGGRFLAEPVVDLVPDPDGVGYWLVASDGGIFAFEAPFRGSVPGVLGPGQRLNQPVIGAVAYGNGYVMVASDGGAFVFSDRAFEGSLGSTPPDTPIVAIAISE